MKRDMDLVRNILIKIEQNENDDFYRNTFSIAGYDQTTVDYHILLLKEAGLLDAHISESEQGIFAQPIRLTWSGHEFIDAARNDTIWEQTKKMFKGKVESIPYEVLKLILLESVKTFVLQK